MAIQMAGAGLTSLLVVLFVDGRLGQTVAFAAAAVPVTLLTFAANVRGRLPGAASRPGAAAPQRPATLPKLRQRDRHLVTRARVTLAELLAQRRGELAALLELFDDVGAADELP